MRQRKTIRKRPRHEIIDGLAWRWDKIRTHVKGLWEGRNVYTNRDSNYRGFIEPVSPVIGKNGTHKGMVARLHQSERIALIYYPSPGEAMIFAEASRYSMEGGPGDSFPGSVGVITMQNMKRISGKNETRIIYMQACFTEGRCPKLSGNLIKKHNSFRHHLLTQAFKGAREKGHAVALYPGRDAKRSAIQRKLFRQIAERNGMEIEEDKEFIRAK